MVVSAGGEVHKNVRIDAFLFQQAVRAFLVFQRTYNFSEGMAKTSPIIGGHYTQLLTPAVFGSWLLIPKCPPGPKSILIFSTCQQSCMVSLKFMWCPSNSHTNLHNQFNCVPTFPAAEAVPKILGRLETKARSASIVSANAHSFLATDANSQIISDPKNRNLLYQR